MLIVFGNSQTTEQPIQGSSSAWDGDADSPASKMAAAKAVLRHFISNKHTTLNIGMSAFSHGPDAGSVTLTGKSWLYSPLTVDFPNQSWKEPAGTIERWGTQGEGPCTNLTKLNVNDPPGSCTDRSPNFVTLPAGVAGAVGPFFGAPTAPAFIYLDGTIGNNGQPKDATKRIQVTLPGGQYGDAYMDGTLSTYKIAGTHSMEVHKEYQVLSGGNWVTGSNLSGGDSPTVTVNYVPSATLTPDLFYTTGPDAGKEIGFLNDDSLLPIQKRDLDVNANCCGWEFQSNNATTPLIKIPRDYCTTSITSVNKCNNDPTSACAAPQDSLPAHRLLRPQSRLVSYDPANGGFHAGRL